MKSAGIREPGSAGTGEPGTVVTFYSFKGGTGRTMALANVAWILASTGMRVLAVDWDLEAPGLHRYFHPLLTDPNCGATAVSSTCIRDYAVGPARQARRGEARDDGHGSARTAAT